MRMDLDKKILMTPKFVILLFLIIQIENESLLFNIINYRYIIALSTNFIATHYPKKCPIKIFEKKVILSNDLNL
jgi:hypothetical protein